MLLLVLVAELGAPWLIFVPERLARLRLAACGLLVVGQLGIAVTGNCGFFNALARVVCGPLGDDATLGRVLPLRLDVGEPEPLWKRRAVRVLVPVVAVLSLLAFVREIVQTLPGARGRAPFENPLARHPAVLVAVTPTVGVDVAAKESLLNVIGAARDGGTAVLLVSDDLEDLRICTRLLIMVKGRLVKEYRQPPWDRHELIAAVEGLEPTSPSGGPTINCGPTR